jgi:pycsar effector protein
MWLEDGKLPKWAEQVTAIATAVSSLALLSAIGAVIFAARQARETRVGRQAETGVEFFRRWNESSLEETRRLVTQFETDEALRDAMVRFIAENSQSAHVLYRELDCFEQLVAP